MKRYGTPWWLWLAFLLGLVWTMSGCSCVKLVQPEKRQLDPTLASKCWDEVGHAATGAAMGAAQGAF
jgi:hypothetical protein